MQNQFKPLTSIALLLCAAVVAHTKKDLSTLPNYIKVCRRHDPLLSKCVNSTLNNLKDRLGQGISELYIPPLEPLVIPELKFNKESGAIYLKANYKNLHLHGLSNFTVTALEIDTAKLTLNVTVLLPLVEMNANYEMHGKIMMLPLIGEGACRANFTNVVVNTTIMGQRVKKLGRTHIKLTKIELSYIMERTSLDFENLFNGDDALGQSMNDFLNSNWEELSEEMRPLLENAMIDILRSTCYKIFDSYTYDELLPI